MSRVIAGQSQEATAQSRRYEAEAGGKSGHRPETWQAHERRPELMTWATRLVTPGGWPRRLCREAELHAKAWSVPVDRNAVRLSYG